MNVSKKNDPSKLYKQTSKTTDPVATHTPKKIMSMTEISPTLSFSAVTTPPTIAALPSIDILRPKIQPLSTLSVGGQSLSNRIDARLGAFRTRLNPSLVSSSSSPSFV
jgi:hypothetical protein